MPTPLVVKKGSVARASVSALHALAGIGDRQADIVAGQKRQAVAGRHHLVAGADADAAALGHGIAGIDAEIEQRQLELVLVGHHRGQAGGEIRFDLRARSERACQQVGHAGDQLGQLQRLDIELLAAGEGQHALGQGGAAPRALHGIVHQARQLGVIGQPLPQQLQAAQDRHQQIVEIMRDAAGELADRIHLLRLEQRLAGALQRLLGVFAFGDVAGDLGEAEEPAILAADGIDHHMRPEAGAVLAHPPAFAFEPPLSHRGFQRPLRHRPWPILLGIESREMLADDFIRGIALDALGAGVPVGDDAFRARACRSHSR